MRLALNNWTKVFRFEIPLYFSPAKLVLVRLSGASSLARPSAAAFKHGRLR